MWGSYHARYNSTHTAGLLLPHHFYGVAGAGRNRWNFNSYRRTLTYATVYSYNHRNNTKKGFQMKTQEIGASEYLEKLATVKLENRKTLESHASKGLTGFYDKDNPDICYILKPLHKENN